MITQGILKHAHRYGLSSDEVSSAYRLFFGTMVSSPRLRIINLLRNGKKNVSEIIGELKMSQTAVSHDLARLKRCGFVKSAVKGKYRYYELNKETIKPLMSLIDRHMSQYCIHIINNKRKNEKYQA